MIWPILKNQCQTNDIVVDTRIEVIKETEAEGREYVNLTDIISAYRYNVGERIEVSVDITANHKGFFEFRVCDHNNPKTPVSEACLQRHLLKGDGGTRCDHVQELARDKQDSVSSKLELLQVFF